MAAVPPVAPPAVPPVAPAVIAAPDPLDGVRAVLTTCGLNPNVD